jgi:hypothetical protein
MDITRPSPASPFPRKVGRVQTTQSGTVQPGRRLLRLVLPGIVLVSALAAVPLSYFAYLQVGGLILPGVHVGGVPVQGMGLEQATAEIDRIWNQEYRVVLAEVENPAHAWVVAPSEFGLGVDAAGTAQAAYRIGRGDGLLADLLALLTALGQRHDLRPTVTLDLLKAQAGLESWSARVAIAPTEGILGIHQGLVQAVNGQSGRSVDIGATLSLLAADPAAALLDFAVIPLVMQPVAPRLGDVSAAAAQADAMLASGLALQAYDPVTNQRYVWAPSPEEIGGWLAFSDQTVTIDQSRMRNSLGRFADTLGEERSLDLDQATDAATAGLRGESTPILIIHYRPTEYVVQPGESLTTIGYRIGIPSWRILEYNPSLPNPWVSPGTTITLPPRDANLPLPVIAGKRIVISLSQQRLWAYQDGQAVREEIISTGIARSATLPGVFQVQTHVLNAYGSNWDLWMPHFLGIYEALPDFWNGIHGLPLLSNGVRLWADVLGRPASYGCIILDLEAAEWMYAWAQDGVVVEIRR